MRLARKVLLIFAVNALAAANAQVELVGSEFRVSSSPGNEFYPSAAMGPGGGFVVVWSSSQAPIDPFTVQGRRFEPDGTPLGDDFYANTDTTHGHFGGATAVGPQGNFLVVWDSDGSVGNDNSRASVQGQLFAWNGARVGTQFQVNSYTRGPQFEPAIAAGPNGEFVVVWHSGNSASDEAPDTIRGRRYSSTGARIGAEFQVNSFTPRYSWWPTVAVGPQGQFLVVWQTFGSRGSDRDGWSVQARAFKSDGTPAAAQFQVNSVTTSQQEYARVAAMRDGQFVVVWTSYASIGNDNHGTSIEGRRFESDGSPAGREFLINSLTSYFQSHPAVAANSHGGFTVAWQSEETSGSDDSSYSIQARQFAPDGKPLGKDIQVNSEATGHQGEAAIASGTNGQLVVVWNTQLRPSGGYINLSAQLLRPTSPELGPDPTVASLLSVLLVLGLSRKSRRRRKRFAMTPEQLEAYLQSGRPG